ncbi:MAG: hypothetical protein CMJ89_15925 [Planctomycetes bacterium]|jgi:TorA maturation chaperone TorD|nr:hypothetical protein [Planctomycetota bacterium]
MTTPRIIVDSLVTQLAAREYVLRLLSLSTSDPASQRFARVFDAGFQELACAAASHLAKDLAARPTELASGEEPPEALDLSAIVEALHEPRERLVEDHTRVFSLVVSKECPPYEVEYCPQTFSVYRSQRMADIAGFYHAFGVEPGRDVPERVDHIACELEFLAWLVAKERHARTREGESWAEYAQVCRDAQRDFLSGHVAWWVPAFARALRARAHSLDPAPSLPMAVASALASLVPAERFVLGVEPPDELARPSTAEDLGQGSCESRCSKGVF